MKKRFIFFTLLLLTLIGGANWNVLNAQEIVEIGSGNSNSSRAPIATYYKYSYSQQILTASEINHDAGTISSIAFKIQSGNCSRNITIYMQNTTKTTFDSTTDWVAINANDNKVFEGNVNFSGTDWITLDFTNDFTYDGGNILLCMQDNSGSSGGWTYFLNNSSSSNVGLSLFDDGAPLNPDNISGKLGTQRAFNSYIQLTFTIQDDLEPATPTSLVAEAVNHTSIQLTWDAAENANSYNVYKNGTLVGPASTTSYLVEGLDANTGYCFTVTGVRGAKESAASEQVCATTAKAPLVKEVLVGAGDATGNYIPTYTFYNYSTTQQIYTAEELGFSAGNVTKIAFYNNGSAVSRNIDVYITNTTKANFTGGYDMINMTAKDKVYSGTYTFTSGWCEIAFSKAFEYTGGNILICVDDNTGSYVTAPTFKANVTADYRANYRYDDSSGNNYDPLNVAGKYTTALYQNNQIKFFVEAEPGVTPNVEAINFAEVIRLGNYWSEKYTAPSAEVKVENIGADITSIESSNDFFVLSENIDLAASNIVFNVTCKTETSYAGTQNGNIVISYEIEGEASTVEIPVSATAYAPVTPDVIELATNVTESAYTNTPDFATLHDDYILPGEATEGSTPDAVYHFTMENEGTLTVNVTGTNAIAAVYKAEDMEGSGPMANNNYKGVVPAPAAETTFEYTFEDVEEGKLSDQFTVTDADGDGNNWDLYIENNYVNKHIISYSWYNQQIFTPENYIVTNKTYLITENSRLTWDYKGNNYPDNYAVVISEDGVNFDIVAEKSVNYVMQFAQDYADLGAYAGK